MSIENQNKVAVILIFLFFIFSFTIVECTEIEARNNVGKWVVIRKDTLQIKLVTRGNNYILSDFTTISYDYVRINGTIKK